MTVTGSDQYGNGYSGQVTLSASDGQTVTPATVTLVNGTATLTVTLDKERHRHPERRPPALSAWTSGNVTVSSALGRRRSASTLPSGTATTGAGFSVTVTGSDQHGNGYDGTVTITAKR